MILASSRFAPAPAWRQEPGIHRVDKPPEVRRSPADGKKLHVGYSAVLRPSISRNPTRIRRLQAVDQGFAPRVTALVKHCIRQPPLFAFHALSSPVSCAISIAPYPLRLTKLKQQHFWNHPLPRSRLAAFCVNTFIQASVRTLLAHARPDGLPT